MIEISEQNQITLYCTKLQENHWEDDYIDIIETPKTFELMKDLKREFQKIIPQITFNETFQIVDKVDWVIYEWPVQSIELNKTFIILYI